MSSAIRTAVFSLCSSLDVPLARPALVRSLAVYEPVAFAVLDEAERIAVEQLGRYQPDPDGVDEVWLAAFVDWWNGAGAWQHLSREAQQAFRSVGWKLSQEVESLRDDRSSYASKHSCIVYAKKVPDDVKLTGAVWVKGKTPHEDAMADTAPAGQKMDASLAPDTDFDVCSGKFTVNASLVDADGAERWTGKLDTPAQFCPD